MGAGGAGGGCGPARGAPAAGNRRTGAARACPGEEEEHVA